MQEMFLPDNLTNIKTRVVRYPARENERMEMIGTYRLPRRACSLMMRSSSSCSKLPRLMSGLK